jgi:hypothetical protein
VTESCGDYQLVTMFLVALLVIIAILLAIGKYTNEDR